MSAFAAAVMACIAVPARAAEPPLRIEIIAGGRYVALDTGTTAHEADPGAAEAGVRGTDQAVFVEHGERLTLRYCTKVGIRFRAPGVQATRPVPITVEILHPLILFPDGMHEREVWQTTVDVRPRTLGVTFDEEGMMKEGIWTINIMRDGHTLATQHFELDVPPELGPEPDDCSSKTS